MADLCLTRDRRVVGSSFTGVTVLCPWARHINPSFKVLVQPRKIRRDVTKIFEWDVKNQIKQTKS